MTGTHALSVSSSPSSSSSSNISTPATSPSPSPCPSPFSYFASLTRSPALWFDDGNLILQADTTLFKVYRGHLAARSTVFRDMFAFPPPVEGNSVYDGCAIVQVYDRPEDMEMFLKALLDSEFFEPPPTPTTLSTVASILRLSTKYDVKYLLLRSLSHLHSTYPTTLPSWRTRDTHRTIPSVENTPFAALKLASEFGLDWLVPAIVYCICSHDLAKTLDGASWEGGRIELGWEEKRMCVLARNKILVLQNAHALSVVRHPRPSVNDPLNPNNNNEDPDLDPCPTPEPCTQTRLRIADILTRWGTAGFLDFYDEQYDVFSPNLCKGCLEGFRRRQEGAVRDMWRALPGVCGVGVPKRDRGVGAEGNEQQGEGNPNPNAEGGGAGGWDELERLRERFCRT